MPMNVPIRQRPRDDGAIDYVWVHRALAGSASAAKELTRRELATAVHLGRSKSAKQLAELLFIHQRQVERFRAEPWPGENLGGRKKPAAVKQPRRQAEPTASPRRAPVYQQLELVAA